MSVQMNATSAITAIVEGMLPRFSPKNRVLLMGLDVGVRKWDGLSSHQRRRFVYLMFHRPDNYTKAMWNVGRDVQLYNNLNNWEVKSDHDSCWRTDGLEYPLYKLVHGLEGELKTSVTYNLLTIDTRISFDVFTPRLYELEEYSYDRENRTFTVTKFGKCVSNY